MVLGVGLRSFLFGTSTRWRCCTRRHLRSPAGVYQGCPGDVQEVGKGTAIGLSVPYSYGLAPSDLHSAVLFGMEN